MNIKMVLDIIAALGIIITVTTLVINAIYFTTKINKLVKDLIKELPKKVKSEESAIDGEIDYICPVCHSYLINGTGHCSYCGQALDWGDE